MIVMKFGGTSVGSAPAFRNAIAIVERSLPRDPVVVVSALSGVTDLLIRFASQPGARADLAAHFEDRHRALAREADVPESALDTILAAFQNEVRTWDGGHGRDAGHAPTEAGRVLPAGGTPPSGQRAVDRRTLDRLLSFGERTAAVLLAAKLDSCGISARALHAGEAGLVTDERFGAAHPLPEAYARLRLGLASRPPLPVVTGFIGRTRDGETTTLGRGGSDFSAAIIGAACGAEEIQIWTDTSGMMSADPRIVPEARPVPRLSFAEASELAYFGARVLHPKTILPAVERGIVVRVLNTQRPEDPGSRIAGETDPSEATWRIKSIACKKGVTSVTVESTRMLMAYGFLARVFEIFGRHRIVVDLVTTSEVSISLTLDDPARLEEVVTELESIGRVVVKRDLAVIAVVGEGAATRMGLAGHVFTLLGGVGIGVEMISQGASRINLSFVVKQEDAERAVRLLHRGLGLDAMPAA